ncbi:hypothetical protein KCU65_g49, partial [Aureobasidium melanogenum]
MARKETTNCSSDVKTSTSSTSSKIESHEFNGFSRDDNLCVTVLISSMEVANVLRPSSLLSELCEILLATTASTVSSSMRFGNSFEYLRIRAQTLHKHCISAATLLRCDGLNKSSSKKASWISSKVARSDNFKESSSKKDTLAEFLAANVWYSWRLRLSNCAFRSDCRMMESASAKIEPDLAMLPNFSSFAAKKPAS